MEKSGNFEKMSGNFGHLTHVRELSGNFVMSCWGIAREFCYDIFLHGNFHYIIRDLLGFCLCKCLFGQYKLKVYWLLPAAMKLGQGNVFTGVCDSVHRGGVCLSACWDTTPLGADTPQSRHPLGADTPPRADTPPEQTPPWEQTPHWSRHPPRSRHLPEQTPLGVDIPHPPQADTPPPRSRLRHTVNEWPVRILLECILVTVKLLPFKNPEYVVWLPLITITCKHFF